MDGPTDNRETNRQMNKHIIMQVYLHWLTYRYGVQTDGHIDRHTDRHIDKRREESRKFVLLWWREALVYPLERTQWWLLSSSAALLPINRQRMKAIVSDTILCFSCFAHSLGQGIATQEHIYLAPSHQINRSANVNPRCLRERLSVNITRILQFSARQSLFIQLMSQQKT